MRIINNMCTQQFSCPLCTQSTFNSIESLRIGLVSVATRPLSCPICNEIVIGIDKLTIHLFGHTIVANTPNVDNNPLNKQLITNLNEKKSEINLIIKKNSVINLNNEKIDLINEKNSSEINLINEKNSFDDFGILKDDLMSKNDFIMEKNDKIVLKNCNNDFIGENNEKEDFKNCHNDGELINEGLMRERCNICGLCLNNRNSLILHKKLAHKIAQENCNVKPEDLLKNYPCHLCSKVFKMRGSLMVHMRVAHTGVNLGEEGNTEGGFNCPLCGKNFKKEQHVTQHLKTHEGKQWECDVCSKMFTTKYFLKKHKRLHSGEMPYQCNICSKTFTFQQSYHKHRLYHKDDKPHTCSACGRSFKELSTLHNHERIHTGEKPFACETCGKCFRQRVSYLVHRRIHTGVMPYTCPACRKSFRYKVSQRTHKCPGQSEHQENPQISSKESNFQENGTNKFISSSLDQINKFIVIPNSNGEPTLTREIDLNVINSINDQNVNLFVSNSSKIEKIVSKDEKSNSDAFFSLIMENNDNPSSPATEMGNLTLTCPENNKIGDESGNQEFRGDHDLQKDLKHAIDGILSERNRDYCLETINEESLKELLNEINKNL